MNQLFIILISILLLSFPVFGDGHKLYRFDSSLDSRSSLSIINYGETLYGWGEYPDYVWKGFGDKDTQPKYQGQVKDGKPNGLGDIIYPDGSSYVGGWENGKYQGQGTYTKPDGTKYIGSWKIIGGFSSHWNGEYYDEDGIIKYKWVNGKLIKQYKT